MTPKIDDSKIYRLTEYIWHMFTTESLRGNLLIHMQLILACKVHILVCFSVFESFPIHAGDYWVLKRCEWKMKVVTFMKSCDFYEKLWLEKLWLLWKVVTFMKSDDLSKRLWLFQRFVTFPLRHNKNLFALPCVLYKFRDFLSF